MVTGPAGRVESKEKRVDVGTRVGDGDGLGESAPLAATPIAARIKTSPPIRAMPAQIDGREKRDSDLGRSTETGPAGANVADVGGTGATGAGAGPTGVEWMAGGATGGD